MLRRTTDTSSKTYFDSHAEDYAEQIMSTQPVFYENAGRLLNEQLPAGGVVLGIGNGGVINYNFSRLSRLDCGDLVVSQLAIEKYHTIPNIRFFRLFVYSCGSKMASSLTAART